jgi:hypothetical protein
VKDGRRQVPFERQVSDAEGNPKVLYQSAEWLTL